MSPSITTSVATALRRHDDLCSEWNQSGSPYPAGKTRIPLANRVWCTSFGIIDLRSTFLAWNSRPLAAAKEMPIASAVPCIERRVGRKLWMAFFSMLSSSSHWADAVSTSVPCGGFLARHKPESRPRVVAQAYLANLAMAAVQIKDYTQSTLSLGPPT